MEDDTKQHSEFENQMEQPHIQNIIVLETVWLQDIKFAGKWIRMDVFIVYRNDLKQLIPPDQLFSSFKYSEALFNEPSGVDDKERIRRGTAPGFKIGTHWQLNVSNMSMSNTPFLCAKPRFLPHWLYVLVISMPHPGITEAPLSFPLY